MGKQGKDKAFTASAGAAAVEAFPVFFSSFFSTPSSLSGGHTPLKFRVQRWHGLAGCQAWHGMAPLGTAWHETWAVGSSRQPGAGL